MKVHRLFDQLEQWGHALALIGDDAQISYAELAITADEFALRLPTGRSLVFLEAANNIATITALVGCLRAGHVVHLMGKTDASRLQKLAACYRPAAVILQDGADLRIDLVQGRGAELHPDLAVLLSTSGSTGSAKFVKLSHENLRSNARAIGAYLKLTPADRAITSLSFNYSYGLSVITSHLLAGGSLVLEEGSVTDRNFWDRFSKHGCTSFAGVPSSFQLLHSSDQWAEIPTLRYVTVAGGRMEPHRVAEMARLGRRHAWNFYVMYGQTEAAPRMAYLPPSLAESHCDHIGGPVPGGELFLMDDAGHRIDELNRVGELAYRGPNVMMGYASQASDLALDETPAILKTGDLAVCTGPELFRIVGRKARFVKPFGIRINLDEVETLARETASPAVAAGDDNGIVIAVTNLSPAGCNMLRTKLAESLSLPPTLLTVRNMEQLPLLPNGKIDYAAIASAVPATKGQPPALTIRETVGILSSPLFYRRVATEALVTLGLKHPDWSDVTSIFETFLGRGKVTPESTFTTLNGDSMCFIQTSLALEAYLGDLPANWERLTIAELEELRHAPSF